LERRSLIFGEAFQENILEKIFGTPSTDYRRSLLRKYSTRCELCSQLMKDPCGILNRGDIWDIIHRSSAKPLEKYLEEIFGMSSKSESQMLNEAFLKNISGGIFGESF